MSERAGDDRAWADYSASLREMVHELATSTTMLHVASGIPREIDSDVIRAATQLGLMLLTPRLGRQSPLGAASRRRSGSRAPGCSGGTGGHALAWSRGHGPRRRIRASRGWRSGRWRNTRLARRTSARIPPSTSRTSSSVGSRVCARGGWRSAPRFCIPDTDARDRSNDRGPSGTGRWGAIADRPSTAWSARPVRRTCAERRLEWPTLTPNRHSHAPAGASGASHRNPSLGAVSRTLPCYRVLP